MDGHCRAHDANSFKDSKYVRARVQEFRSSGGWRLEAGSHGSVRCLPRVRIVGLWATRPDGRMVFVPEGQHDRSQARSAWNHEENSSVPAGRLNGSVGHHQTQTFTQEYLPSLKRLEHSTRCCLLMPGLNFDDKYPVGLTMTSAVPPGRKPLCIAQTDKWSVPEKLGSFVQLFDTTNG
jgi:hypothetical protein